MTVAKRSVTYALILLVAVIVGALTGSVVHSLEVGDPSGGDDDLGMLYGIVFAAIAGMIGLVSIVLIEVTYQIRRSRWMR